jgi:hypothetical protein
VGLGRGIKEGFLLCEEMTYFECLVFLEESNQVWGEPLGLELVFHHLGH